MAKKQKRTAKKNTSEVRKKNGFFSKINLTESYTSLILGAIVVVIIGILFLSFARNNKNTSSVMDIGKLSEQIDQNSNTSSTYTINPGDDLWTISEKVYNDGFKWMEIAKLNKLSNPELIQPGDKLIIPKISQEVKKNIASGNISISENTYTIKNGDCLWDIAIRAYGDGYKWLEIARANNLSNPDLIYPDNVLIIPR